MRVINPQNIMRKRNQSSNEHYKNSTVICEQGSEGSRGRAVKTGFNSFSELFSGISD